MVEQLSVAHLEETAGSLVAAGGSARRSAPMVGDNSDKSVCHEQLHPLGSWLCWASSSSLLCSSFSGLKWWRGEKEWQGSVKLWGSTTAGSVEARCAEATKRRRSAPLLSLAKGAAPHLESY
jgi:hypothetical protein